MDVCTSAGGQCVGCDGLYLFQATVVVAVGDNFARQFINKVCILSVRAERQMTRTGTGSYFCSFGRGMRDDIFRMKDKAQDAVGTEVGGKYIFPVRREDGTVHVRAVLSFRIGIVGHSFEQGVDRFYASVATQGKYSHCATGIVGGQHFLSVGRYIARTCA